MPNTIYFSKSGVKKIADNVHSAAQSFRTTQRNLDTSIQQLRNAAFRGIVGDDVLESYDNVVKDLIDKVITRAEEYAKDLEDTIEMMDETGLASP